MRVLFRSSTSSGTNGIWQSADSDSLQAVTRLYGTVWGVAGVGDFNGDNKADILWRNSNNGYNTIWLSANSSTGQAVPGVGGQDWQIVGLDRKSTRLNSSH